MKVCPHCSDAWDEKHTEASIAGIQVIGCPKIAEGVRWLLTKSEWKPEPRCIMSEINNRHMDHVKNFGDRRNPIAAYLGKAEVALVHEETQTSRCFGAGSTIQEFCEAMSKGSVVVYTPYGRLSLYAVDAPSHLAIGGAK